MRTLPFYFGRILLALIFTSVLLFSTLFSSYGQLFNAKGRDFFFRLRHSLAEKPSEANAITFIDLDDETLSHLKKRWPYPRSLYAEALRRMMPLSPKAVGFDLIFSGNDFTPESDLEFSQALKEAGNVVIATHSMQGDDVAPLPLIHESAWRIGIVDKPRDRDYLLRRALLVFPQNNETKRSWELEIFTKAFPNADLSHFPLKKAVPINYKLQFKEFRHISFWKVLEGTFSPDEIRNKIILIGLTAEVFHDIHATPLRSMPGLAVNANTLLMLIRRDFFTFAPLWVTVVLGFFFFWLVLLIVDSSSILIGIVIVAAVSFLLLIGSFLLFTAEVILDPWLIIVGTILTFIGSAIMRQTQLLLENLKLQEESSKDPLTGFYNRRFLTLKLKSEFNRLVSKQGLFKAQGDISVVMIDLDNFKLVNDSFGHAEGDRVLSVMAQAIRSSVRKSELVCRFGGDEFCVILPSTTIADAVKFAEKIRSIIAHHPDLSYRTKDGISTIQVTGSIGVASVSGAKVMEHGMLMKAADRALYRAKAGGRNQVCVFDPSRDVIT
ncbi:MAG: hypothetical protein A3A81_06615 [Omnitrophica bacterium RIFCSPLOWO2_01_FULL_45_10b]|nr:MAG: hypothetical protein A3A81_06615 [Omnitrophica bacterium RIFCSPLOWO2_01_FULL_45_10b]